MSDFFDSDIVREELQEINELQMSIYKNAMKFGTFSREDKVDHIERLTELLERQKVMYTRISLSDDKEAIDLKNHLQKSVELMGSQREQICCYYSLVCQILLRILRSLLTIDYSSVIIQISKISNLSEVSKCLLKT